MGNEAFAHAALEAGVRVVAGYPGTPSSELIETVAKLHGEGARAASMWSGPRTRRARSSCWPARRTRARVACSPASRWASTWRPTRS
nr:hypothetical protein [Eggerthella sinensis]